MSRIAEVSSCACCPWVWWDARTCSCHNPDTLDKPIADPQEIPPWCMLDELLDVEDE